MNWNHRLILTEEWEQSDLHLFVKMLPIENKRVNEQFFALERQSKTFLLLLRTKQDSKTSNQSNNEIKHIYSAEGSHTKFIIFKVKENPYLPTNIILLNIWEQIADSKEKMKLTIHVRNIWRIPSKLLGISVTCTSKKPRSTKNQATNSC